MRWPPLAHLLDGFWTPLRDPTYWRLHTVPHLLGGLFYWALLWPLPLGWWAVYAVGAFQLCRQEILREMDPANYPLWAIVWDVAANVAGASLGVLLVRWLA